MSARRIHAARGVLLYAFVAACSSTPVRAPTPARLADSVSFGYGTMSRRDVTGSVGSVVVAPTARHGVHDVAQLIEGRVPGVEVVRHPGGDFSLRVRGGTSSFDGGEPLVVVDGTPLLAAGGGRSALVDINPADVARIDVLKGAAAAIYGVRGSNGVVVVTLRRPRQ